MSLPEHVFALYAICSFDETSVTIEDFPTEEQGDSFGTVLYFSPVHGWMAEHYSAAEEMVNELNCTHWTFTPAKPS